MCSMMPRTMSLYKVSAIDEAERTVPDSWDNAVEVRAEPNQVEQSRACPRYSHSLLQIRLQPHPDTVTASSSRHGYSLLQMRIQPSLDTATVSPVAPLDPV